MRPFIGRQQCADEDLGTSLASPGPPPQHFQSYSVVVVLGVIYPTVLPRLVEAATHPDQVPLPPGLDSRRRSTHLVFYDPLSSRRTGEEVRQTPKYPSNSKGVNYVDRIKAQKAVARDLALLSSEKAQGVTSSQPPSASDSRTPIKIFDWKGLRLGDEMEVLDDGLAIARGVIEDLAADHSIVRLKFSHGRGGRTYHQKDGWQVRAIRRES